MRQYKDNSVLAIDPSLATISGAVAIASGKGGVGKTWLAISLAHALARRGERVVLFDGDLGLANIDIQLGFTPATDLGTVLDKQLPLSEGISRCSAGFDVIAGRSGSADFTSLSLHRLSVLADALRTVSKQYDRLIIDLGAGIDRTVRFLAAQCQMALIVVNDEPTTLTDAYAFIKMLLSDQASSDIHIVVNSAQNTIQGQQTYTTLSKACQSFLKLNPPLLAVIHRDTKVKEAIRAQTPLLTRHPTAIAAKDVEALANQILMGNIK